MHEVGRSGSRTFWHLFQHPSTFNAVLHFLAPFSWRPPRPGSASTAVARKRTQTRSIAIFIVQKMCLRTGRADGAGSDACSSRAQLRVLRVLTLTLTGCVW